MEHNIILLIGPSGAGKSTTAKILKEKFYVSIFNTDDLIKEKHHFKNDLASYRSKIGEEAFFEETKQVISDFNSDSKLILFDIGAGSLDYGIDWFKQFYRICLVNTPEILQPRREKYHKTLESYISIEMNSRRKELYNSSHFVISTKEKSRMQVAKEVYSSLIHIIDF